MVQIEPDLTKNVSSIDKIQMDLQKKILFNILYRAT